MANPTNEIDQRHFDKIVPEMRYTTAQAAQILGCSRELVIKICDRGSRKSIVDSRHFSDFLHDKKYSDSEVARRLNVSHTTIYNLRKCGFFEQTHLRKVQRIPGWSIIDFLKTHSYQTDSLSFLVISNKLFRIPGWSLVDYIKKSFAN